jgi:hypothetical protein
MDQELMLHVESTFPRITVPNESTHGIRSLDRSVRSILLFIYYYLYRVIFYVHISQYVYHNSVLFCASL